MRLEKVLLVDLQDNKISLADAIVKALSHLKDKESDTTMSWLSNELQGYRHPLDFYYQPNHNFPEYRVVNGSLKLMNREGSLVNLEHALADRGKYFLSAPVSWLEESASLPGDLVVTEIPELSHDMGAGQIVVVEYSRSQLDKMLDEIKNRLINLLQ